MANDYSNMDDKIWENTRTVSDGSMTASNEQLALIGFVYRLGSLAVNNESGIAHENDVRKEARLLMSLSCSSPMTIIEETTAESGRVTPQSDVSTCSGTSSRRSSFSFACPSLSLENHSQVLGDTESPLGSKPCKEHSLRPSVLLGRVLKVDDVDAMRLSSEAMARNIMESFQKAMEWRINTWVESLSQVIYEKEMTIKSNGDSSDQKLKELLYTSEAKLLLQLQQLQNKIEVMDARTSFKVLPQRLNQASTGEPVTKRRRLEDAEDDVSGLEETEYQYEVAHALSLEVSLNMECPGAGYVQIDLQVPGSIKGTFLSSEIESEILTDVMIELNTDILATMIEKSSRMVVRSSVQALLEQCEEAKADEQGLRNPEDAVIVERTAPPQLPAVTAAATTPKRSRSGASRPVFVTPQDSAPRTPFSGKEGEAKPLLLSIPDNFGHDGEKRGLRMLSSQAPKSLGTSTFSLQKRPSSLSREVPQLVTPLSQTKPSIISKGKGPNLPVLVEVACAAMDAK